MFRFFKIILISFTIIFSINDCITQPINDNCSNAVSIDSLLNLGINANCFSLNQSSQSTITLNSNLDGATDSVSIWDNFGCEPQGIDYWYSWVADQPSLYFQAQNSYTGVYAFLNSCNGGIKCIFAGGNGILTDWEIGDTIKFQFYLKENSIEPLLEFCIEPFHENCYIQYSYLDINSCIESQIIDTTLNCKVSSNIVTDNTPLDLNSKWYLFQSNSNGYFNIDFIQPQIGYQFNNPESYVHHLGSLDYTSVNLGMCDLPSNVQYYSAAGDSYGYAIQITANEWYAIEIGNYENFSNSTPFGNTFQWAWNITCDSIELINQSTTQNAAVIYYIDTLNSGTNINANFSYYLKNDSSNSVLSYTSNSSPAVFTNLIPGEEYSYEIDFSCGGNCYSPITYGSFTTDSTCYYRLRFITSKCTNNYSWAFL